MSCKEINRLRKSHECQVIKSELYHSPDRRCYYCGKRLNHKNLTVDHKTPLSKGGENTRENMCLCCTQCNGEKGNMTEEEYRNYLVAKILSNKKDYQKDCFSINIELVKIPWRFQQSGVKEKKSDKVKKYYDTYGEFDKPIVLKSNHSNYLADGYSRYVVAKSLGLKEIMAVYGKVT